MHPIELPKDMPERPTKADAEGALAILEELLLEFPFVDQGQAPRFEDDEQAKDRRRKTVSFSVALSELLTPVGRAAIDFAPMQANRAPVAGTGKSYLSDIASAIANGTRCPVISAGKDEEELEKRLGSEILAGISMIDIDNAARLSGSLLCQVVTQEVVKPRILQKSETPPVSNVFTVFANGNNLQVSSELTRRTLFCLLDAWMDVEKVQARPFARDPVAMVLADRGKYIAACLTILRAHHLAGYPCKAKPEDEPLAQLIGFKDWSNVVRGALVWLGKADPIRALEVVSSWRAFREIH
jgi:putative DNA primase/helicase